MSDLKYATAWVTSRLGISRDEPVPTLKHVREWVGELETLGVPEDTELDECLLSIDVATDTACGLIMCGNAHTSAGTKYDLITYLHDCDDPSLA